MWRLAASLARVRARRRPRAAEAALQAGWAPAAQTRAGRRQGGAKRTRILTGPPSGGRKGVRDGQGASTGAGSSRGAVAKGAGPVSPSRAVAVQSQLFQREARPHTGVRARRGKRPLIPNIRPNCLAPSQEKRRRRGEAANSAEHKQKPSPANRAPPPGASRARRRRRRRGQRPRTAPSKKPTIGVIGRGGLGRSWFRNWLATRF